MVEATSEGMITQSGEFIAADLRIWAAGVKGPDILKDVGGLETTRNNQLVVKPTLQTTRDDRIFAIGDCASFRAGRRHASGAAARPVGTSDGGDRLSQSARLDQRRALKPFVYKDHGSLVSLSHFSTVGSLMGNLIGGRMAIEGRLARFVYVSLYRMHLIAIHGWLKGVALILVGHVNHIIRPR